MPALTLHGVVAAVLLASSEAIRQKQSSAAYEAFRREFGVDRSHRSMASYQARVALFEKRQEEVRLHNMKPGALWVAAVNKFADYTEAEFHGLLGHRRTGHTRAAAASALVELQPQAPLAQMVDWRQSLNTSTSSVAKDQGSCGSCWAVAAAGALETHAEITAKGPTPLVSYEQLVDCVENPHECGGAGGCKGATSELALEYVQKNGLVAKSDYKGYESGDASGKCKSAANPPILSTQGFVRLPENKYQPLLEAVSTVGPVVVSAAAGRWGSYSSGVFNDCGKDAIINHAILAMGYGTDTKLKADYWLIRNSWGPDWGENGFIRLMRHSGDDYCGTDNKPLDGVACKDKPITSMPVCGMCGVLSDSSYPTGVKLVQQQKEKQHV